MKHAPHRTRLPETRRSVTCKRDICGFEVYITIGFFDDGTADTDVTAAKPGEVFVKIGKHGDVTSGLMDTCSLLLSVALQYGVPWEILCDKLSDVRFGAEDGKYKSLIDGIARVIDEQIRARESMLDPRALEDPVLAAMCDETLPDASVS